MQCSIKSWCVVPVAVWACLLSGSSSARGQLPAIDPSGQRIFLPPPNYTTLAPRPEGRPFCVLPRPAFVAPPTPPPCDLPGPAAVAPPAPQAATVPLGPPPPPLSAVPPAVPANRSWHRQRNARLQLSPTRLLAPVGSEVVLRAGLCGDDGYFVGGQPIEWMLSGNSGGTLVDVDTQGRSWWRRLRDRTPQKKSGAYAIGWTSTAPQVLSRGTPSTADDLWLREGETWVSLTSGSEGTSHVTAVARVADGWNLRRKTATIHWFDGQWSFPAPTVGRVGQARILTTNVRRKTSGAPVPGWLVRYEVAAGAPAVLDPGGARIVDVRTDARGNANVPIIPQGTQPGTTQLRIKIIRTATAADDLPRLLVGEGATSVTWSAAGLMVRARGPSVAELKSTVTYSVEISNPGDLSASGVSVSSQVPTGLEYVSSEPPAQVFGDRLQWQVDQLSALELRRINVHFRATRTGPVRFCATATPGEGSAKQSCVTTTISARALSLQMEGPDQAQVGDQIQFRVTVTNTGDQPLTNVVVSDRFDSGLRHFDPSRPDAVTPSPIERSLGSLDPGQSRRFAVSFVVQSPGQLCHRLDVTTAQGARETAQACVVATGRPSTAAPPSPMGTAPSTAETAQLTVKMTRTSPETRHVGDTVEFSIRLRNSGSGVLTNVRVVNEFDPALAPLQATPVATPIGDQLVWQYPKVLPRQAASLTVRFRCVSPSSRACTTVTVTADQNAKGSDQACVEIVPAATVPPPERPPATTPPAAQIPSQTPAQPPAEAPAEPGPRPATEEGAILAPPANGHRPIEASPADKGSLLLTVNDVGDPVATGERAKYYIAITNQRSVSDKQVVLKVILPDGNAGFTTTPPAAIHQIPASDGRTVSFSPIAEMRAGETVHFIVEVTLKQAGTAVFHAEVTSQTTTTPVTAEEDTTVSVRQQPRSS